MEALLQKFDASRDQLVSARQTLIDKVAAAKDDTEREAALKELRDEQKSMEDVQRTTAKEIRAELETLRRQRAGGG